MRLPGARIVRLLSLMGNQVASCPQLLSPESGSPKGAGLVAGGPL